MNFAHSHDDTEQFSDDNSDKKLRMTVEPELF